MSASVSGSEWAAMTRVHSDSRNLPLADWEFLPLGTICLPHYLDTGFEDHENPALAAIFIEAIPQVVEILHAFQHTHPIIDHVNKYFANKPVQARRQKLAEWMAAFGLVSTPELDAVLQPVLEVLLVHAHLADLPESDRNERVMGVGSALLQLLAVQDQLKEPLNLNGDLLNDFLDGRVVHCSSDGDRGLDAMFASIPLPRRAEHSRVRDRALLKGNSGSAKPRGRAADEEIAKAGRRTKRKADEQVEGEKVGKRAKKAQIAEEKKRFTPTPRRLRSGKAREWRRQTCQTGKYFRHVRRGQHECIRARWPQQRGEKDNGLEISGVSDVKHGNIAAMSASIKRHFPPALLNVWRIKTFLEYSE
ncbi:hypothetical protein B0H17DRAFT_1148630 [Mycena rosella]|uniref:Uncharacterized protein n=1 Tax=Mycena rosella TaxID=1033263 RepID=A0AAD7FX97_MYCRO|nr:hypothetical protein B0H17DRAFT_1148630 [Mycena rosella]